MPPGKRSSSSSLPRAPVGLLNKPRFSLALGDHEMIVVAIGTSWTGRNIPNLDKLPVGHIGRAEAKVIAHSRRDVEAGAMIQIGLRSFILENILEMVSPERPAVFPLRIAHTVALANCEPTILANRMAGLGVSGPEPWDDQRRFWLKLAVRHVVIGQRAVEWILPRHKRRRYVTPARPGAIKATII